MTLPERCCTLKISPLVRELILTLATKTREQLALPATSRLVDVLFDEVSQQPQEQLQLPVSPHPKIRMMSETMAEEPAVWQTLAQWANHFAMSERNLARLVVKETGLSFRRWRHQLQLIVALLLSKEPKLYVADATINTPNGQLIASAKHGSGHGR